MEFSHHKRVDQNVSLEAEMPKSTSISQDKNHITKTSVIDLANGALARRICLTQKVLSIWPLGFALLPDGPKFSLPRLKYLHSNCVVLLFQYNKYLIIKL